MAKKLTTKPFAKRIPRKLKKAVKIEFGNENFHILLNSRWFVGRIISSGRVLGKPIKGSMILLCYDDK